MRTYYLESVGTCRFDTESFLEIFKKKYGVSVKRGCEEIVRYINEKDEELCMSWKRIYSWLTPSAVTGRYTVPNSIDIIDYLAKSFGIEKESLLKKVDDVKYDDLIDKDIAVIMNSSAEEILLKVVMAYVDTDAYNYVSLDNDDDGIEYWCSVVEKAREKIRASEVEESVKCIRLCLCHDLQSFIKSYEYADGLSDMIMDTNHKLHYFQASFGIIDESLDLYVHNYDLFKYHPSTEDIINRARYFEIKRTEHPEYNEDELFMRELAETVNKIYNRKF